MTYTHTDTKKENGGDILWWKIMLLNIRKETLNAVSLFSAQCSRRDISTVRCYSHRIYFHYSFLEEWFPQDGSISVGPVVSYLHPLLRGSMEIIPTKVSRYLTGFKSIHILRVVIDVVIFIYFSYRLSNKLVLYLKHF